MSRLARVGPVVWRVQADLLMNKWVLEQGADTLVLVACADTDLLLGPVRTRAFVIVGVACPPRWARRAPSHCDWQPQSA